LADWWLRGEILLLQAQAAQNLIRQIAFEHRIRDMSGGGDANNN